MTYTQTIFKTV